VEIALWAAVAIVLYAYAGYPALVALAARVRPGAPIRKADIRPRVTAIVVARNEETRIAAKLASLLALDYPRDSLDILVVSDGSTDRTEPLAREHAGVALLALPGPRGKAACLNDALPQARGELLLLSDARQEIAPDALAALVAYFADPTVGAVSGELHLAASADAPARDVGLYWRLEKSLRRAESRFDSTVGVTGALYAVRRELFPALDPRTILDDVAVPMAVVARGRRVLFAPEARVFDRIADDDAHEFRRKVRTLAGNFQLVALQPWLLNPFRNRLFWQTVSHKLLRLLVPWCLALVFVASLALAQRPVYAALLLTQLALYGLALLGWRRARRGKAPGLASAPYAFALLNLAAAVAFFAFLRGSERAAWKAAP
jgi:cellulose synthase/poly-beta-1,6-N-acetylglucosamine synthase-like glycosyltransferase